MDKGCPDKILAPHPVLHGRLLGAAVFALALAGCAAGAPEGGTEMARMPFRADFGPDGFATITSAPPADYTAAQPAPPEPKTAQQIADERQFARVGAYQARVGDEVQRLAEILRRKEAGNFVTLNYDNEGEPGTEFQFLRDGPQTLRKYSDNPTFRGVTVRWSMEELNAASDYMWATFGDDRVLQSTGIATQKVTAEIMVSEAEFTALAKRKGATIPEPVDVVFNAARAVPLVNPPMPAAQDDAVPADVAPHIRIFPRDDRPTGAVHAINSEVRVTLVDGCFRAPDRDNALVLFPYGARLFVDSQNYLAFGAGESPQYARVGEKLVFGGSVAEIETPALIDPIHDACGPGRVIKIEGMASANARAVQDRADTERNAITRLQSMYGLDRATAERAVFWLQKERAKITDPAVPSLPVESPPPPVMDPAQCEPGTKLSFGLCRTPEGFVRPFPSWLKEFLAQDK